MACCTSCNSILPGSFSRRCLVSVGVSEHAAHHALTLSCSTRLDANFWTFESSPLLSQSPKTRESAQICHTFQAVAAYRHHPPAIQCATINRTASVFQGCMLYNITSAWQLANIMMRVCASRRWSAVTQHHNIMCWLASTQHDLSATACSDHAEMQAKCRCCNFALSTSITTCWMKLTNCWMKLKQY